MHSELWWGILLVHVHLEDCQGNWRITLRGILGRYWGWDGNETSSELCWKMGFGINDVEPLGSVTVMLVYFV
jgi:hypothetical protein